MGTAINLDEIKRFEVTEVYSHPDAKVDIVLVHGLNGDPRRTWTSTKNDVFWPTELLPATLKSVQARILVYGYNADVYAFGSKGGASSDMIYQHAQSLITNLAMEREIEEKTENPIIFVAHSLGGVLVKRALELSNDLTSRHADKNRKIYISTYGIIFLGTPHTGADPAKWGLMLENMVHTLIPKKIMHSDAQLVKTLQTNNETLQNINLHFLDIYQRFRICMAHEEMKTDLKGTRAFIVDQTSASPMLPDVVYFGIAATHSGMCKFDSKSSPGYLNVSTTLKSWIQDAPRTIQPRIELENKQREDMRRAQAAEILGIFPNSTQGSTVGSTPVVTNPPSMNNSTIIMHSTASIAPSDPSDPPASTPADPNAPTPYFIKPSGFRPNSLFVGRTAELAELHRLLFDRKKRAEGTSAVLIQSMPGGGKTHLAREYVYTHRSSFPGGVFWLRAKSQAEIAAGFWDIARKVLFRDEPQQEDKVEKGGRERAGSSPNAKDDPQGFIKMVKKWLNRRQDWLMVLDGIHFDDAEGLKRFIPDNPNTSLIYTSTEKSASGNYHFMNPQLLKLPSLSAREAQLLLLMELGKREPFAKDDLQHTMELVQSISFLPVVIHAVAQRLNLTGEHLGRFAKSYASEPRLRGLGTYIAVVEQLKILGAYEALNLMYILCFFSQHIPVEMIHLGLRPLDDLRIPIRASEPLIGSTLNNTFKMLNTFALIDRNASSPPSVSSSLSSSQSSTDMLADNIDVIRLHSVVQGFFSDTLLADKDGKAFPMWLDRAVSVFCCSYDMANERITRKTNAGLVEDYRLYEIHGNRLRDHITRHEKKFPMPDTLEELQKRLTLLKMEIERRTPASAKFIAGGKPDAFQTSIFDRTSSSSETGPETPGNDLRLISAALTWSFEPGLTKHESPTSLLTNHAQNFRQPEFRQPLQDREIPRNQFPPLPFPEDPGYDSDHEDSIPMTVQSSLRTLVPEQRSPISPGGTWETVKPRRPKAVKTSGRSDPQHHRTTRTQERQRYSDSAGAFRALSAVDPRAINPRLSRESAEGFVQSPSSREQSRGRISGKSNAQVSLAHISKNSPPPARGGGMIMDRGGSSSRPGSDGGRMVSGTPSYAAAVAASSKEAALGYRQAIPMPSEAFDYTSEHGSEFGTSPRTPAVEALQRFPIQIALPTSPQIYTPMPPYPLTPEIELDHAVITDAMLAGRNARKENNSLAPDSGLSNYYPRRTGPIPYETTQHRSSSTSPLRNDLTETYQTLPHTNTSPPRLSLSSPDIRLPQSYPILSHDGYTSQPMSRDPSGQSQSHSSLSAHDRGLEMARRRPSLAETEPIPQLPKFSPKIAPTSYQVYERMRDRERAASVERRRADLGQGWNADGGVEGLYHSTPLPQRRFDPTAPSFAPLSAPMSPSTLLSSRSNPEALQTNMARTTSSGSGGVRVGERVIEFGDFPEPVALVEARERAQRGREKIGLGIGR